MWSLCTRRAGVWDDRGGASAHTARRLTSRFFNRVEVGADEVTKEARYPEFEHLLEAEADWYEAVATLGFTSIPRLRSRRPLVLDRIHGIHPFDLPRNAVDQEEVLIKILTCLQRLHSLGSRAPDAKATEAMYHDKTIDRLKTVRDLIPNADRDSVSVNGQMCRNPLHPRWAPWFHDRVQGLAPRPFVPIHGDPTFSNVLVGDDGDVWLIDPRGTFGGIPLYGDIRYDWAKLLYSVMGNYDQFNRGRFLVSASPSAATVSIESGGWEAHAGLIRAGSADAVADVDFIHAVIWLSLTSYVVDDHDAVLAAFYNGLRLLEQAER